MRQIITFKAIIFKTRARLLVFFFILLKLTKKKKKIMNVEYIIVITIVHMYIKKKNISQAEIN